MSGLTETGKIGKVLNSEVKGVGSSMVRDTLSGLVVPNGSLGPAVQKLFEDAGIPLHFPDDRSTVGTILCPVVFPPPRHLVQRMRPQDMAREVGRGTCLMAISGQDLIAEATAEHEWLEGRLEVVQTLPLSRSGLGYTRLVVAVPNDSEIRAVNKLTGVRVLKTEFPYFASQWFSRTLTHMPEIIRIHGSTEAHLNTCDAILELTETGRSLERNGWRIVAECLRSESVLFTSRAAWQDAKSKAVIGFVAKLLKAALDGRDQFLVKCDIASERLEAALAAMPAGKATTQSPLAGGIGFALESVVPKASVPEVVFALCTVGATKILTQPISLFVP